MIAQRGNISVTDVLQTHLSSLIVNMQSRKHYRCVCRHT